MNDLDDLPTDEQILARGMLVKMESPDYGAITLPGNPIKMPGALPEAEWTPPPLLGVDEPALWRDDARAATGEPGNEPFDANLVGRGQGPNDWVLLAWSCEACGRVAFGLAERCPTCGSSDGHATTLRDEGVLETWSRIAPKGEAPYIVGYALLGAADNPDAAVRVFAAHRRGARGAARAAHAGAGRVHHVRRRRTVADAPLLRSCSEGLSGQRARPVREVGTMAIDDVYVIGWGMTSFGRHAESGVALGAQALREAIEAAELERADIDALYVGHVHGGMVAGSASVPSPGSRASPRSTSRTRVRADRRPSSRRPTRSAAVGTTASRCVDSRS